MSKPTTIAIEIQVTEDDMAALAFVFDRDRGKYDDPRRPRETKPGAAQPAIVKRQLERALRQCILQAHTQAESHDQMVRANTTARR